jgi:lipid II:glycine glycyltransferase (peptidoglycan interpeptide bridge formation enzyme)
MSKYEARILTEPEYIQWDQFVGRSEMGTVFHSSKWITTVAKNLTVDPVIIGVFNDSQLIGGCFFYIKKLFHVFKIGYTGVPLAPFGGFVIPISHNKIKVRESEDKEHEIISSILEKIHTFNLSMVKLTNSPALIDIRPLSQRGWTGRVLYTYVVDLENDIFLTMGNKTKTNIRKAQKMGIKVKKEYNPEILWQLTKLTYDKQNINIHFLKEYLFNCMEMVIQNNLGEMWIAEMPSGDPIAAFFVLFDGDMAQGWFGSSDPRFKSTGVVSFLYFESFKDLQNRGFHSINMMGANFPQISKFISSFNPRLVPYYSVRKTQGIYRIVDTILSLMAGK